ncbi:hypothetical protein TYRP_018342 [Tyrophagus putrescentiae]|nr:hypothetical protein TYRP_018342 [Tyrophagus putrescentiae]
MSTKNIVSSKFPPVEYPAVSVGEYLKNVLTKSNPDAVAFIDPDSHRYITYGEFHREVEQFAAGLLELGLSSTDLILFFSDNNHEYTVAWFAAAYLGLPMNSVPPALGPYEFSIQAAETAGTVLLFGPSKLSVVQRVFTSEEYQGSVRQIRLIVQFESPAVDPFISGLASSTTTTTTNSKVVAKTTPEVAALGAGKTLTTVPHFPVTDLERSTFAIFYTSGTSGKAKGVVHSQRTFLAMLINFRQPTEHEGQRLVLPFPLGHISGSLFLTAALDRRMTVLLTRVLPPEAIMRLIDRHRVQQYTFTANAAPGLASGQYPGLDLSCLKVFRYGGAKIAAHQLETIRRRYDAHMYEMYGSTEFLGHVSNFHNPAAAGADFKAGNLGDLLPNVQMKIIDLNDSTCNLPANETGEICFRGPPCFVEYLKNEEETKVAKDKEGWYRTGDVGFYNSDGCLFITDRIKEMIKYKLYSVFPAFVEEYITRLSEIESKTSDQTNGSVEACGLSTACHALQLEKWIENTLKI